MTDTQLALPLRPTVRPVVLLMDAYQLGHKLHPDLEGVVSSVFSKLKNALGDRLTIFALSYDEKSMSQDRHLLHRYEELYGVLSAEVISKKLRETPGCHAERTQGAVAELLGKLKGHNPQIIHVPWQDSFWRKRASVFFTGESVNLCNGAEWLGVEEFRTVGDEVLKIAW